MRYKLIAGFTLIELMLVVSIIGFLAAIAIPKFTDLIRKSHEAAVLGQLGAARSAISIYYADNEGAYPTTLGTDNSWNVMIPKYLSNPIKISIFRTHPSEDHTDGGSGTLGDWNVFPPYPDFDIAWFFNQTTNKINIFCTHLDLKGETWSTK